MLYAVNFYNSIKGPIHDTNFQLQPRSLTPTATRLARVWATPTPNQPQFADRGWSWSRTEFSDILWAELKVGVGIVYMGRNDQIFSSY